MVMLIFLGILLTTGALLAFIGFCVDEGTRERRWHSRK
jgi:hypothetical protein